MVPLKMGLQRSSGIVRQMSVVVVTAIALSLGSCASNASPQAQSTTRKQLQVVTTFIPITDFTKEVTGDRAQVTQLLPINVSPHDFQAIGAGFGLSFIVGILAGDIPAQNAAKLDPLAAPHGD